MRGQRFLSLDDPQICRLNRRCLMPSRCLARAVQPPHLQLQGVQTQPRSRLSAPTSAAEMKPSVSASSSVPKSSETASLPRNASSAAKTGSAEWELNVTSDRVVYSRTQVAELLDMIREGNRATGGLHEVGRFFGIVGFIRFTSTYYMVLISSSQRGGSHRWPLYLPLRWKRSSCQSVTSRCWRRFQGGPSS